MCLFASKFTTEIKKTKNIYEKTIFKIVKKNIKYK